jgi:hypothetical protein
MMTKIGMLGAIGVILSMGSATVLAGAGENGHAYNGSFCKPYYGFEELGGINL